MVLAAMLLGLVTTAVTALALVAALVAGQLVRLTRSLRPVEKNTIGFFHPFADGGGGGERVLWCAVRAVQSARPTARVLVYVRARASSHSAAATAAENAAAAGNESNAAPAPPAAAAAAAAAAADNTPESLAADALRRFGVELPRPFEVVPLETSGLVDPGRYPSWTLARQALGSVLLAREALSLRAPPELWVDTTGWAFAYPLVRLAGCRVAAYVHYPTVSGDMLARVARREGAFNNAPAVAASALRSLAKLLYYRLVALLYGACGGLACDVAMANSSWTRGHVAQIWGPWWAARRGFEALLLRRRPPSLLFGGGGGGGGGGGSGGGGPSGEGAPPPLRPSSPLPPQQRKQDEVARLVYPPCDVSRLAALPLDRALKRLSLVSVAQFRPEKDHATQLEAYARVVWAAEAALGGGGGGGGGAGGGGNGGNGGGGLGGLGLPPHLPPSAAAGRPGSGGTAGMGPRLRDWRRRRRRDGAGGALFGRAGGGGFGGFGGGLGGAGGLLSGLPFGGALSAWLFGGEGGVCASEDQDQDADSANGGGGAAGNTPSLLSLLLPAFLRPGAGGNGALDGDDDSGDDATGPLAPSPPLPPLVLDPPAARAARASCLRFVGSCRGPEDAARLAALQRRAERLGVAARCSWHVNAPAGEVARLLGSAVGGLHSMSQEHFGISVVEYMAAGAVPVAHDSGGPRADIVVAAWVPSRGVVAGAGGGGGAGVGAGGASSGGGSGGSGGPGSGGGSGGSRKSSASRKDSGGGNAGGGGAAAGGVVALTGRLLPAGLAGAAGGLLRRRRPAATEEAAGAATTAAAGGDDGGANGNGNGGDGDESYDMVEDAREEDAGVLSADSADDDDALRADADDYEEEDADLFEGPDEGAGAGAGAALRGGLGGAGAGAGDDPAALRLSSAPAAQRARDERRARRTAARRRGRRDGTPPVVGFLAAGVDELAWAIARCLALGERARRRVAGAGRRRAALFSDARFEQAFLEAVGPVLPPLMTTA